MFGYFPFEVLAFMFRLRTRTSLFWFVILPLLFNFMLCFATFDEHFEMIGLGIGITTCVGSMFIKLVMHNVIGGIDSSAMSNGPFYSCFE